jgi:4-amino-4-deoxy-L-arabinose transferase-like glycosyltransferase
MILVYIAGNFALLFENDSAQFAVMAMRMVQENDFLNLFKGPNEYLDKPHMHYWLAAISFKIFGLHDWAYRIPGILATLLGAYSCYGLGKLLYNVQVGKLAALVFMTAQTIVLGAIDVRTDAVLTGFAILAIWQLTKYIEEGSVKAIAIGAFAAGIAFSTKGQIALLVIGLPILCHIAYSKKWYVFVNWKVIVALAVFTISIAPMLYAYYHQFDLHPEKVIRGKSDRSGIFFIFWEQSFERLSGEGIGKNSSDYFFFFHTFLWVFLPWTILAITGFGSKMKALIKQKFAYDSNKEVLTLGGITFIFILISFAQFKLPHYLNVTIPLFSVLTASYIYKLFASDSQKTIKYLTLAQYFILCIVVVASCLLCFYVFKVDATITYIILVITAIITVYYVLKRESKFKKLVTLSVCASFLLNIVLNIHFYPNLLMYQGGSSMATIVQDNNIPVDTIYKIGEEFTWALDFYNQSPVKLAKVAQIKEKKNVWVYANESELEQLKSSGLVWDKQFTVDQFRITRLQGKFLNPDTRESVLNKRHLVHIN